MSASQGKITFQDGIAPTKFTSKGSAQDGAPATAAESATGSSSAVQFSPAVTEKRAITPMELDDSGHDVEKASMSGSSIDMDQKHAQDFTGWTLFWLAFQSVGTVYGDIGTSPLYVFSSTFPANPPREELLGALSLILWSLFLVVTVKYVCITLRADDQGEGGTFALYSLLARFARIEDRESGRRKDKLLDRYATQDLTSSVSKVRETFENRRSLKIAVRLAAIFGVCLILADGIFTPSQSVLGAIQGIRVIKPELTTSTIIGVSCAILVLLFMVQPLGINRLANGYAPIIILWLLFNVASGIFNLAREDASVFKAFNPYFAGRYVFRRDGYSFDTIYGILLCFTGCEALFADMGSFSRQAIQLSWLFFVWPCLMLTYLGQAANIANHPENYSNPFFATLPPGCFYPGLILSILAAIVASQAMITGVFQILSQAMSLFYFPRIRIKFTSTVVHNQCYVPLANWLLMIGCIIVTAVFNNTTALGNAYGLCVILVSTITTILVTLVAIIVWRIHPLIVVPLALCFLTYDSFWIALSILKIPDGAWVTIAIAAVLAAVFIVWRTGKSMQWQAEAAQAPLLRADAPLDKHYSDMEGVGIFFDEQDDDIPSIFYYWLHTFKARHEFTIFAHLRQTYIPTVSEQDRYRFVAVNNVPHAFRVLVRTGYSEPQSAIQSAANLAQAMEGWLDDESKKCALGSERQKWLLGEIEALRLAKSHKDLPVFLFGRKFIQAKKGQTNLLRKMVVSAFALIREFMTSKAQLWELPSDQIVEIGKAVLL